MIARSRPPQPLRCDPERLVQAPEMAVLRVLDEALEAACFALLAEHPSLVTEDARRDDPATLRLAQRLLRRAAWMERDLRRYAAAVDDSLRPVASDDLSELPF
jgi:hypothetical protein